MTTRLTSILAILASGLFLAACQDDSGSESESESSESGSSMEESSTESSGGSSESQ